MLKKIKVSPRVKYFLDYALKGAVGSLIMALILMKTKIFIFSIFPFLGAIGLAAMLYTKKIKSLESNLFVFLDDLRDLLQGGMNIVTSMEVLTRNDYGALNEYLKRVAAQVKIGIPFDQSLINVFDDVDSPLFSKVAEVISESTKYGGNLIKVFSSVSNYVKVINDMSEERKSRTFSTVFSSYFMFFIFIAIILTIQIIFLPMLSSNDLSMSATGEVNPNAESLGDINFNSHFLFLLIIQAGFAGPIIGKISENSAVAGIKHSIILLAVSVPLYVVISILFV